MVRKAVVGLAVLGMVGCTKQSTSYNRAAGSLATSQDGALIYAVDSDNNAVEIARAEDGSKVGEVKVGKDPARITVGADGRIYVSNRGDRSVSVLDKEAKHEVSRVPVGVEPNGLALSNDGKTLYVVSATDVDDPQHGTLTAVDTESLKPAWRTQVGEEPRGVAVVGNKAYVTNLKQGRVMVVDTDKHQVATGVDLNTADNPDPTVNTSARTAGAVTDVAPSPDGERVYTTQVWQLAGSIDAQKAAPGGGGSYGAPADTTPTCNTGAVVTAGVGTIVTATQTTKTDSLNCTPDTTGATDKDFPPSATATSADGKPLVGPSTALVDPSGNWLFVANRHSNNVSVMPTHRRLDSGKPLVIDLDPNDMGVGAGPDGLALSKDGKTLFVYSQLDHTLHVVRSDAGSPTTLRVVSSQKLAGDTLPADVVVGRKMFFSARDPRMTAQGTNMACAGCHLEGREDGHVWLFPDGPRQTPSLAGRHIELTAPYHWAGLFPTIHEFFKETIQGRMGGAGVSYDEGEQIFSYIQSIPQAENPLQNRVDLQPAIARGQAAFTKANCASCHTSEAMTDNQNHDVGTLSSTDRLELFNSEGIEDTSSPFPQLQAVNTPSLLGLGRTAPYLHDGSVLTVRGRIDQARSPKHDGLDHGDTSNLSDQEIADLETYLLSL